MYANRILLILIMLATLALGIFVQLKDRKNAVNISFNILTITIAIWTFSIFMILTIWDQKNPISCVKAAYATGTFMATSFAIFSIIFLHENHNPAKKYMIFLIPMCIIMAVVAMTKMLIINIDYEDGKIIKVYYGIGNTIWSLYEALCWWLILYSLVKKLRKGSGIERQKVKYMFLGIMPTITFMAFTNILIPAMGHERLIGYGPYFTMIMIGCIAYAIVKHRLMDIRVFIRKGIVYSTLLAVSAIAVALLVIGVPRAFSEMGQVQSAIVFLIGGGFIVFAIRPFSQNLKTLMQTFVFKEQYHYRLALIEFSSNAIKTFYMEKLLDLIFKTVIDNIKMECASLWIKDSQTELYNIVCSYGNSSGNSKTAFSDSDAVMSYLVKVKEPAVKEELEKSLPSEVFDSIEDDFNTLNAEISVPLFAEDKLIGMLCLGSRPHRNLYFEEDITFLKAVMSQSSIAIQNVKLHQQVVNMEKLSFLGRLSAELAHEIKNPLVTIKTAFEFLMSDQSDQRISDDFRNFVKLALQETNRINTLIKQLLDLGRSSPPKFEWFDINQVINETFLFLKPSITEKNIEVIDFRNDNPIDTYADKDQLRQVFINIGQNAIDAMKKGGKLTVEVVNFRAEIAENDELYPEQTNGNCLETPEALIIKISDTGKGMSKPELKNIFEPFYSGKPSGTGLGLAIVKNIIHEHNGNIKVDSAEGLGTTFTIELPIIRRLNHANEGSSFGCG
ncbi:MAG: ATP-binding protein [Candidatus Poribacteria bacterium]